MNNPFIYSNDNKRYHTLYYYNSKRGGRRCKAAVNCGFTCPNIDGTRGVGGCTYCSGGGGYFTQRGSVTQQLETEAERIRRKHPDAGLTAYFQSNTNTYAPVEALRELYTQAINFPGVCGLSVATRADILPEDVISLLREISVQTELTVELGLQTVHDVTAERINRCHTFAEFVCGYEKLQNAGIRTCVHIINGLPGEDEEMMLQTAKTLGKMSPQALKIHMLHIVRGTRLAEDYTAGLLRIMSRDEYVRVTASQLEYIPPQTVIERITGDGDKNTLLAPVWSRDKIAVIGALDKYQADNDTWQGKALV